MEKCQSLTCGLVCADGTKKHFDRNSAQQAMLFNTSRLISLKRARILYIYLISARAKRPKFPPPRDRCIRICVRRTHQKVVLQLARMPFGSPEQQRPGSRAIFTERNKRLTPISKIKRGLGRLEGTGKMVVVLVSWGVFNPIHLANIHMLKCARKMLEEKTSFAVVGVLYVLLTTNLCVSSAAVM